MPASADENRKLPDLAVDESSSQINLLHKPTIRKKWLPGILYRKPAWNILSGKWEYAGPEAIIYKKTPDVITGENISVIGSACWTDYTLSLRLKILSKSIKPPEGGAIIYYRFMNIKNYYSLHFCFFKKTLELIKRSGSKWSTVAVRDFSFEKERFYEVNISAASDLHRIEVDKENLIELTDNSVTRGSIGIGVKFCDVEYSNAFLLLHKDN